MATKSRKAIFTALIILALTLAGWISFIFFGREQAASTVETESAGASEDRTAGKAGEVVRIIPRAWADRGAGDRLALAVANPVFWQDVVWTEDAARLQLALTDGSTLNLGSNARLQILEQDIQSEQPEFLLTAGKLIALVKSTDRKSFRVRTSTAVLGVIGTRFYLEVSAEQTIVICLEGSVSVRNVREDIPGELTLRAGEKTVVAIDQPPTPKEEAAPEEIQQAIADTSTLPTGWLAVLRPEEEFGRWGNYINSVEFLDRRVGWAVGPSYEHTAIFQTIDGGDTWKRFTFYDAAEHPPDFQVVRFWDSRHGWIGASQLLLYTSDGGESWAPVDIPKANIFYVNCLVPVAADKVMAGRNGGWILVTDPNGANAFQSKLGPDATNVAGLASVSDETFFAVTASPILNKGSLYRSSDGGKTWTQVFTGKQPLNAIAFSGDRGVIVGNGVAYWSWDSGASWQRIIFPASHYSVAFAGENTIVSVGEQPSTLISHDGGKTWQSGPALKGSSDLREIEVVEGDLWFATGGYSPAVYRFHNPDTSTSADKDDGSS